MLFNHINGRYQFRVQSEEKRGMVLFPSALLTTVLVIATTTVSIGISAPPEAKCGSEGQHARSITLNGTWKFTIGGGMERAETQEGQAKLIWKEVRLPGQFMPHSQKAVSETAFVWARRKFELTAEQVKSLVVLRWNYISLGATAFINGVKVGQNEPIGPYQTIIRPGVLRAGENEIVLKIAGTRGARKAESGYLLFPAGFGSSGDMLSGIRPEWLIRWNGLPGTVAVANLEGPGIETAEKILWVRDPSTCVAAEIPITGGKGTILFSQLDVQRHVNSSGPAYDPVADRILINMLEQTD